MHFTDLGLSEPILRAISDKGYAKPTAIQAEAIPAVLAGRDLMAAAQTGTGKTAGFTLPILQKLNSIPRVRANQCSVLILAPTRELAAQIGESVEQYSKYIPVSSLVVFGGVKINPQMMRLRRGVDILVATPGRLLDLYQQNAINFKAVEVLVLDEADRMLDMGFIHDIRKILALLPKKRQNLLFSATFSKEVKELAQGLVHNPLEITIGVQNSTVELITHWLCAVDKSRKSAVLAHLIEKEKWRQALVFTRTKHGANKLTSFLNARGIKAAAIHGNKGQAARTKALESIKDGTVDILVATDIAARGLDIDLLPQVVNFDLPHVSEDYIHRIGRTGRAGATGQAVSLVCADEFDDLKSIERLLKQVIERRVIAGFDPVHPLPESRLDTRPLKPKRPKKNKSFSNNRVHREQ